jgi:hypothetical protein
VLGPPCFTSANGGAVLSCVVRTGLSNHHLMQFLVDADENHLYAVGSCGYRGGLSVVDLQTKEKQVFGLGSYEVCGEKAVATWSSRLVIAKAFRPIPAVGEITRSDGVIVVDPASGRVLKTIATSGDPVDILVAHRE